MSARDHTIHRRQTGVSLVELMVAMTIGLFLIGGAFYVYVNSRDSMEVTDTISRLQERARFALDTMEPDLRLASYWGLHNNPIVIDGRVTPLNPTGIAVDGECGDGWVTNLEIPVEGRDHTNLPWADCIADEDLAPNADTVSVRHAAGAPVDEGDLETGRLYVRTDETQQGALFVGNTQPGGFGPTAENRAMVANGYYIRPYTFGDVADNDGWPSLRRLVLGVEGGQPAMRDQEVIPGVEDMQIQFGVDTDAIGSPTRGSVNRYVDADNPILDPDDAAFIADARVLAVRVWLVVRSEDTELGYADNRQYRYANREYTVPPQVQGFRRLLVSRTIFLRNQREPV